MSRLRVVPIVEGYGEIDAIRILLQRIWSELLDGEYVDVLTPVRTKRNRIVQRDELTRVLELAVLRLREKISDHSMVLLLLDADDDLPCVLGPDLLRRAQQIRSDADITCVIANVEYETWFVAAADSLGRFLAIPADFSISDDPEGDRQGKGWIKQRFRSGQYSPRVDQPRMTQAMDLTICRQRSPSFDKLCRELKARRQRNTSDSQSN